MIVVAAVVAGAVGAVLRHLTSLAFAKRGALPWAVLTVNVVGCAIGGATLALAQAGAIDADAALVLLGGLAGGLTTFSTWSVESVQLVQEGKWRIMAWSVGLNLVLGLLAVVAALGLVSELAG